jgi:ELWxxDGT repeat protein
MLLLTLLLGPLRRPPGQPFWSKISTLINDPSRSSNPQHLAAIGQRLYFSAEDSGSGAELWSSDGTPGGTAIVSDIRRL